MGDTPFVALALAQVTIRPRKLGYLIQAGHAPSFRKAVRYAFTEWGGLGHPIAPVRGKARLEPGIWQYLDTLKPEVMIDFAGVNQRLKDQIEDRVGAQVMDEAVLGYDEPGVHCLVTVPPGSLRGRTMFHAGADSSLAVEVAIGGIQAGDAAQRLWAATGAHRAQVASALDLLDAQLDVPSPLWITKQHFRMYLTRIVGSPIIVYTDPRPTLNRLLGFWNVRALSAGTGEQVLWLPAAEFGAPGIAERLEDACLGRPIQTVPDLLLLGPDNAVVDDAAAKIGLALRTEKSISIRWSNEGRDLVKSPLSYWRRLDPRQFLLGDRREGIQTAVPVTVTKPETVLQLQSPVPMNSTIGGKVRIAVDGIDAIRWPRRAALANLILPHSTWSDAGLDLTTAPSASYRLSIQVPEAAAVITACLAEAGWAWAVSDKGRYASALVGAVANRTTIDALRNRTVLRVIRALGSLTSRKATQVLQSTLPASVTPAQIQEAVSAVVPTLVPRWLTTDEAASAIVTTGTPVTKKATIAALSRLLSDRLVTRAFRFRCSNCGLLTHIPLDGARDHVRCIGCTAEAPLLGPAGEPELTYGLNSLLDRASDQDCHGHLPVEQWMHQSIGVLWSVPGADLTHSSGTKREIDVLAISPDELVVAEVKNAVTGFTDPVVLHTASLAKDLDADHLVLAAIDDWDRAQLEAVRTLAQTQFPKTVTVIGLSEFAA